jgi:hypothetical protein
MKPIYLTKGGKRLVMAKHMKKMSSEFTNLIAPLVSSNSS